MILITGAPGFFGIHATKLLLESGKEVVALGTSPFPDVTQEYFSKSEQQRLRFVQCDISNHHKVSEVFEEYRIHSVIHAAVITILGEDEVGQEQRITSVNALGTLNLLEASRAANVSRFVYVSSSGLYGTYGKGISPVHENIPVYPGGGTGIYLGCKIYGEMACQAFEQNGGLNKVAIARLGSPYGPWERPTRSRKGMSIMYKLIHMAVHAEKARVLGRDVMRDWTHMRDIARGIVLLATCEESRLQHTIYNVTSGVNVSIEHVLQTVKQVVPGFRYEFVDSEAEANVLATLASSRGPLDISRLIEDCDFKTEFNIDTGLADYANWMRSKYSISLD